MSSQPLQVQPIEINDFSGGMTDNPFDTNLTKYHKAQNIVIKENLKLETRAGSKLKYDDAPALSGIARSVMALDDELLFQVGRSLYNKGVSGFTEILGVGDFANPVFTSGNASSYASWTEWNKHLFAVSSTGSHPVRIYKNAGNWKVAQLGLPRYNFTPTFGGPANSGGDAAHSYAFHLEQTYESDGVTYMERGPVVFLNEHYTYGEIGPSNNVEIQVPFEYTGNSTNLYDTSRFKLAIYRNTNAGSVWYRVGVVDHGPTSTFIDSTSDDQLVLNDILYIDGGVLQHEAPPECKIIHQVNDITYFGVVKEGATFRKNKMRWSNRFMPWSAPSSFEEEFDDEIVAITSVGSYPIILCRNSIYRVEGYYDMTGAGTVRKKRIYDRSGCVSARSVIVTEQGVFFAGSNGFYFTDGNSVNRISNDLNISYKKIIDAGAADRIYGAVDLINHRIFWSVTDILGFDENNKIFVGHTRLAQNQNVPFTYFDGGLDSLGFSPVAMYCMNGNLIRTGRHGYIFEHSEDVDSDLLVDPLVTPDLWKRIPIIHSLQSLAINFGGNSNKKWVPYMTLVFDNLTDLHVDIFSSNDNVGETFEKKLKQISSKSRFLWGDPSLLWGDPVNLNVYPVITAKRYFNKGGIRCFYRQLRFTNANALVEISSDANKATIAGNTVSLLGVGQLWPVDYFNLEIAFEFDGYKVRHPVTALNGADLTIVDEFGFLPQGETAWKLYALPINEKLSLISYQLYASPISPTHTTFRSEA